MTVSSDWGYSYIGSNTGSYVFGADDGYQSNKAILLKNTSTDTTNTTYVYQYTTAEKGKKYTLSAYIKANIQNIVNNKGVKLFVKYETNEGTKIVSSEYIENTKDWQRVKFTFDYPSNATGPLIAAIGIEGEQGEVYIDNVQLEQGEVMNSYNWIVNGDFTHEMLAWNKNADCTINDKLITTAYGKGVQGKVIVLVRRSKQEKIYKSVS
ncbi:MAG: carbohydrate binding domain-containing protein [Clostridia bacterium]|nr:carbohydrate binding domain-containing protein [Clostridia bacterium]MDD4375387.1 carbohydrate binding domain-containing protein [Clostridia bacterium]